MSVPSSTCNKPRHLSEICLTFQIENCLNKYLVNETLSTSEHENATKTPQRKAAGTGRPSIKNTGFSTKGSGNFGANRFNMNFLICRIARTASSLHNSINTDELPLWKRWISTAFAQPDYSTKTEKMVGHISLHTLSAFFPD
jgi:hypothetical protein